LCGRHGWWCPTTKEKALNEKLLTIREVSELLGIPVGTIYQWRYSGTGPKAARMGRHLRYRPADVEAWVEGLVGADRG
jgi:excisionase family DNA binding protein